MAPTVPGTVITNAGRLQTLPMNSLVESTENTELTASRTDVDEWTLSSTDVATSQGLIDISSAWRVVRIG